MNIIKPLLMIGLLFMTSACEEPKSSNEKAASEHQPEDASKYRELVNLYVGKTVPYSQYNEIGQPKTLSGTNNSQWVAYFPKANFTIVTNKKTDKVRTVYIGKHEL